MFRIVYRQTVSAFYIVLLTWLLIVTHFSGFYTFYDEYSDSSKHVTCCTLACSRSPSLSTSSVKVGLSCGFPCQQSNMIWYLGAKKTPHSKKVRAVHKQAVSTLDGHPSFRKWMTVWTVFICYLIFNMQPFVIWPRLNLILSWCWVWRLWDHAAVVMSLTSCQQSCPCGKTCVFPKSFHCSAVSHCVKECSNRAPWMFKLCTTTCYWSGLAGERFMSCFHIFGLCKYI